MMVLIYFISYIAFYILGYKLYHSRVNPITIYSSIWFGCFFIYNSGVIQYYPINWTTFLYIYGANIVFVIGCISGFFLSKVSVRFLKQSYSQTILEKKKSLQRVIILTTILSLIGIIPNIISSISTYGINLLANTSNMYFNEISSAQESALSFTAFAFVTAIYVGIYIVGYGFDRKLYFPLLMFSLFALSKGSRGTFVIVIFLLLAAVTLPQANLKYSELIKKNLKKLFYIFLAFTIVVLAITSVRQRSENIYYGYLSLDILSGTVLVSVIGYICSGIGCLNQFLEYPLTADSPVLFFRVFYVLLDKLGITDVNTVIHFPTYLTPIPGNVLTYIGELYIDFQDSLFIVILILSIIFSFSFCKAKKSSSIFHRSIYAAMFTYFCLSFFASFLHAAGLWYAIILGTLFSIFIDYRIKL